MNEVLNSLSWMEICIRIASSQAAAGSVGSFHLAVYACCCVTAGLAARLVPRSGGIQVFSLPLNQEI